MHKQLAVAALRASQQPSASSHSYICLHFCTLLCANEVERSIDSFGQNQYLTGRSVCGHICRKKRNTQEVSKWDTQKGSQLIFFFWKVFTVILIIQPTETAFASRSREWRLGDGLVHLPFFSV